MKYHGINGADRPSVLGIRTGDGGSVDNGLLQPQANNELDKELATAQQEKEAKSQNAPSKFAFKEAEPKKPVPKNPKDPGFTHPSGEETPEYKLVESGCIDLADAWEDVGRGIQKPLSYPKTLSLRISLPGINSVSEAELDVTELGVSLVVPGKYRLELCLPYPVDSGKGRAKFIKASKTLSVDLPTVPPSPPQIAVHPPSLESRNGHPEITPTSTATLNPTRSEQVDPVPCAPSPVQDAEENDEPVSKSQQISPSISECVSDGDPHAQDSECRTDGEMCDGPDLPNETTITSEKGLGDGDVCSKSVVEGISGRQELTENQKKWMELHGREDTPLRAEESQAECETSENGGKDGTHQDENTAPKGTISGKSDGEASSSGQLVKSSTSGSDKAKAAISGVVSGLSTTDEKEKTRATKLSNAGVGGPRMRPRISRTVAEELD
ncbi:hypothetical protein BSKO_04312 [Bryopsis sp. KO-2023]|nr:hypothetical protein BSKO_04312 [Bryopsis sp. KO-2023]